MNEAKQAKENIDLHFLANHPIHKYIGNILSHLELRQEAAKRFFEHPNSSDEYRENIEALVRHCNEKISQLLSITN